MRKARRLNLKKQHGALVRPQAIALRLVIFGLYVSVMTVAIATFLIGREIVIARQVPLLPAMGLMGGLAAMVMVFVLPRLMVRSAAEDVSKNTMTEPDSVSALGRLYAKRTLIGIALLEGGALLNVLCFVGSKHAFSLLASFFLAGCVWLLWPTKNRIFRWVAAHMPSTQEAVSGQIRPVEELRKSA